MIRKLTFMSIFAFGLLIHGATQASGTVIETQHLIVTDANNTLSDARLKNLADQAQAMFERILAFWSADSEIGQFGKIRVIFDAPRRRDYYTSVVDLAYKEHGRSVRAVLTRRKKA